MEHFTIILIVISIIFFSKILSSLFQQINLPPVLAMILVGIVLGPTGFNLIHHEEDLHIIKLFSQIGVVILLFLAGLETDLDELKSIGKNSFMIALGGIIFPFIFGFSVTFFMTSRGNPVPPSIVMGLILTATSVSVSVMTLMDIGKLKSVEGNTIVSAAIIDDVIGIILLSIIFGFLGSDEVSFFEIGKTIGFVIGYFVLIIGVGFFIIPYLSKFVPYVKSDMFSLVFAFFVLFLFAWISEKVEIAAITGAFFAGLFLGRLKDKHAIEEGTKIIGHTLFVTIFFVSIGLETNLRNIKLEILPFVLLFIVAAFGGKILGCGFFAKIIGFDLNRAFRIGAGMSPRGEVALIIASIAMSEYHFIAEKEFTAVIFMVIITAFVTPFVLKLSFNEK
ncbi:MAG: cation:proton antiporter [Spirochaetes bacterium]|nr:cation:proton antiporter [Spirochaetota bacterium]